MTSASDFQLESENISNESATESNVLNQDGIGLKPDSSELQNLQSYRVKSLPSTAYYIANFLNENERSNLFSHLQSLPSSQWTYLSHRRLQPQPAPLTPTGHLLTTKSLPSYLQNPIIPRLLELCEEADIWKASPHKTPNHCLVNEYNAGEGISKHQDGAAYWPVVATVSLGSGLVLEVERKQDDEDVNGDGAGQSKKVYRIYQEPGSLLITTDEMYTQHLHGISGLAVDEDLSQETVANWDLLSLKTKDDIESNGSKSKRSTRISLTYRDVLKVKDPGKLFGGRR